MTSLKSISVMVASAVLAALPAAPAAAQPLSVTIENLQPTDGGFFLTPVWVGFHDGGFDLYDAGVAATPGLELIAEDGDPGVLRGEFASASNGDTTARYDSVVFAPGGFGGAPVLDAGETVTAFLNVPDSASNRYFSFASMVIPSNDAFVGNGVPTAYEVFDAAGASTGPLTIEIFGSDIHDSGTEVNDTMGAAFSMVGGTPTDENGTVISVHAGLDNFVGTGTPVGTVGSAIASGEPVARITIRSVPEPATLGLLATSALACVLRRRR